jgi:hypothetical protein
MAIPGGPHYLVEGKVIPIVVPAAKANMLVIVSLRDFNETAGIAVQQFIRRHC